MATQFAVSPILRLRRSPQSGNYIMTAAWQTVYAQVQAFAWMFASGRIDLSNMLLGDQVEIRVSSRNIAAGPYIIEDEMIFNDVQPVQKPKIVIGSIIDTFGVIIEMRQTAGVLRTFNCEFFDAVR